MEEKGKGNLLDRDDRRQLLKEMQKRVNNPIFAYGGRGGRGRREKERRRKRGKERGEEERKTTREGNRQRTQ